MDRKHTLHDVPIFEKLSATELKLLTGISKAKRYRKNQIIFLEGEVFSGFYVVLTGSIRVYKLNRNGEEIVLSKLEPFRSFAESSLFSGSRFYSACAQAIEDSSLMFFPSKDFASVLGKNPALAIRISEGFAVRLMELNQRFDLLADGVEGRVARYLLNEIQLNNTMKLPEPVFNLSIPKKDLAEHLGVADETLSRMFRKLKDDKVIREVSKRIFVTNLKRLRELAQE
jgi:CRP/FNR family transcriptional regulator, dissimilatory nitrate respiration regulator